MRINFYSLPTRKLTAIGVDEPHLACGIGVLWGKHTAPLTAMSTIHRDDRPALIALFLVLASILILALLQVGSHYSSHGDDTPQVLENTLDTGNEVSVESIRTRPRDFNFWQDPFPQYAMALFSALAAVASFWAIFEVRKTFRETQHTANLAREANDIARELGQAQIRAYVFCDRTEIDWDGQAIRHIVCHWKNGGQSPAKKVATRAFYSVIRPPGLTDMWSDTELETIEALTPAKLGREGYIAPQDGLKTLTESLAVEVIKEWRRGDCDIIVHGYCTYVDEFRADRFSRFCFRLVYDETSTHHVTHFERMGFGNRYE